MSGKSDHLPSGQPPQDPGPTSQEFQHSQVSARVPEKVGQGVFSTGILVLQTANEFVLDFVQGIVQPRRIAARVIVAPSFIPNLLNALRDNLAGYQTKFGPPPPIRQPDAAPNTAVASATPGVPPPPPAPPKPTPIEDIYDQLKLPDDMLAGVYANSAMIVHTQTEFCIDFIASFYPRAAVSCRVYMAAPQIPVLVNTLAQSLQQYQQKQTAPGARKPPDHPQVN